MTWINLNIKKMQNKQFLKIKNSLLEFFFIEFKSRIKNTEK